MRTATDVERRHSDRAKLSVVIKLGDLLVDICVFVDRPENITCVQRGFGHIWKIEPDEPAEVRMWQPSARLGLG